MKKILVTVLLFCTLFTMSSVGIGAETTDDFSKLRVALEEYLDELAPNAFESMEVLKVSTYDEIIVFMADYELILNNAPPLSQLDDSLKNSFYFMDNYLISTYNTETKSNCPIFALVQGEIMMFRDAYSRGFATIEMLDDFDHVECIETVNTVNGDGKYEAVFVERLHLHYLGSSYEDYYSYEELYFHYSNPASADETEPEFALVKAHAMGVLTDFQWVDLGKWVIFETAYYYPESLPYFVYVPAEDKIYTIEEAYNAGIKDIDEAFRYLQYCGLRGDVDGNYVINVKDATEIQKYLAGLDSAITSPSMSSYWIHDVADFDRSGGRNCVDIKDATAIQKAVAGLEY